ncbi:MAG: S41 family peptidase, partial [Gemmatimonadaceae bacterium]
MKSLPACSHFALASLLATCTLSAQPSTTPRWTLYGQPAEYDVRIDSVTPHGGKASALLRSRMQDVYGRVALGQTFSVTEFRNQKIRFSTWIRTQNVRGAGAYSSVTFVASDGKSSGFAEISTEPMNGTSNRWILDTLTIEVPPNAVRVQYAATLQGLGAVWLDDISVERVDGSAKERVEQVVATIIDGGFEGTKSFKGDVAAKYDAPRAATAQGLDAMIAFTRLAGYVRFFHPTDSVVTTNWTQFLTDGIRVAEKSSTPDELQRTLQRLFAGVAPTVKIFNSNGAAPHFVAVRPTRQDSLGIAWWVHNGVSLPSGSASQVFSSNRVVQPMQSVMGLPNGINSPDTPVRVDLGAGLSALVPTSLWMTVPGKSEYRNRRPVPVYNQPTAIGDRAVKLAAISEVWMIMQHFYPYFDVVKTDWANELRTGLSLAATNATSSEFESTLKRLVAALHDGNASVTRRTSLGWKQTFGVLLGMAEGKVMVTQLLDSTRTDVKAGDVVVSINGKPMADVIAERAKLTSGATPRYAEYRAVQELLNVDIEDSVRLQLQSSRTNNAPMRNLTLHAAALRNSANIYYAMRSAGKPVAVSKVKGGIWYVDLGRQSDSSFSDLLPRLRGVPDIIFDVRNLAGLNPRMLVSLLTDSTIHSALYEIPIATQPDRKWINYKDVTWAIPPTKPQWRVRAYFLANAGAIASGEALLQMISYYKLGEIVGEPTAGTMGNTNTLWLPGGFGVTWTGMRVRKPDGSQEHGVGVQPTVLVHSTIR